MLSDFQIFFVNVFDVPVVVGRKGKRRGFDKVRQVDLAKDVSLQLEYQPFFY
jgi:hypothetical protein